MIVPDLENPFIPSVVKAIEDAALHSACSSIMAGFAEVEADRLASLLATSVDGLIISPDGRCLDNQRQPR